MVPKLEFIKGGGGSIKVGTTGTIGSLITRELESMNCSRETPTSSKGKPSIATVTVPSDVVAPNRLQPLTTMNGASSSGSIGNIDENSPGATQRTIQKVRRNTHRIPMLGSDDIIVDRTPNRVKHDKRGSYIAEVVDIKCGTPEKAWSIPIANRFKKLSFSKLSETIS